LTLEEQAGATRGSVEAGRRCVSSSDLGGLVARRVSRATHSPTNGGLWQQQAKVSERDDIAIVGISAFVRGRGGPWLVARGRVR
jgi:hypothetical protein